MSGIPIQLVGDRREHAGVEGVTGVAAGPQDDGDLGGDHGTQCARRARPCRDDRLLRDCRWRFGR